MNPSVTTTVSFTGAWCDRAAQARTASALLAQGADVLTQHQDCTRTVLEAAEAAGAFSVGYHYDGSEVAPRGWLAGSVWSWDDLFVDIVRTVQSGRFAESRYGGDYRANLRTGDNPFVLTSSDPWWATPPGPGSPRPSAASGPAARRSPARSAIVTAVSGCPPAWSRAPDEIDRMDFLVPGVIGEVPGP